MLTVLYDPASENPDTLLNRIESLADGRQIESIAFATHDLGPGVFHLTGDATVSTTTLATDEALQCFWYNLGSLLASDGRIDLLACDVARTEAGQLLVSQLEQLTGHNVAASDDATGNTVLGGDWLLETDQVNALDTYFSAESIAGFPGLLMGAYKFTPAYSWTPDAFGYAVAIDGQWAVVGSPQADDNGESSGAAYIYHFENGIWTEQQKLVAPSWGMADLFGASVAIHGNYAVIGAEQDDENAENSGAAYIFHLEDGTWVETQKLIASDGSSWDHFGSSVAISDEYALIGAAYDEDRGFASGSMYVFHLESGQWVETQKVIAEDTAQGDLFAASIAMDGAYAIVGAAYDDQQGPDSGSAYLYHLDAGVWTEAQKLVAADGAALDRFGSSVSVAGDYALIGTPYDFYATDLGAEAGSAYVFHLANGTWSQAQRLTASDASNGDRFGASVSISGEYAIIGANQDDDAGQDAGAAYIFRLQGTDWVEQEKLHAPDGADGDRLGSAVAVNGTSVLLGSYQDDDAGTDAGAAYLFNFNAPEAYDLSITMSEDAVVTMSWWSYVDPHGDSATLMTIVQLPSNATLFLDADGDNTLDPGEAIVLGQEIDWADATTNGVLKLIPNANWSGETSLDYCVKNSTAWSHPADVAITVVPVNDGPVATSFAGSGNGGSVISLNGWNYTDVEGDTATYIRVAGLTTGAGTVFFDINNNGRLDTGEGSILGQDIKWSDRSRVKFAPADGWSGPLSLWYQVKDASDYGPVAEVTINVIALEPPIAEPFTVTAETDTVLTISNWDYFDPNGDKASSIRIDSLPTNGTLFLDQNGDNVVDDGEAIVPGQVVAWPGGSAWKIKFTPDNGWNGATTFSYFVQAASEWGPSAQVTIVMQHINIPPVPGSFLEVSAEGTPIIVDGWNFSDPEGDSATSIQITNLWLQFGTLFLDSNANNIVDPGEEIVSFQEIAWADATVNGMVKYAPFADTYGTDQLNYVVKDQSDYSIASWGVANIVVAPPEPPQAWAFTKTGYVNTVLWLGPLGYTDPYPNLAAGFRIESLPNHGTLFVDSNDNWVVDSGEEVSLGQEMTYEGTYQLDFAPDDGWTGTTSFSYAVEGWVGLGPSADVAIVVKQRPPVAGQFTQTGYEDTVMVVDGWNYTDPEGDAATALRITGSSGTFFLDVNGDNICDPGEKVGPDREISWADATTNGLLKFLPSKDASGEDRAYYSVKDQSEYGPESYATIMIDPVPDSPRLFAHLPNPLTDDSADMTLCPIRVDQTGNNGDQVAAIVWSTGSEVFCDPDSPLFTYHPPDVSSYASLGGVDQFGIAVVDVDNSHGQWEYSLDNGATWIRFENVSETSATLLEGARDTATRIRFVPDAGWSGTVEHGITFHAWNQDHYAAANGTTGVNLSEHPIAFSADEHDPLYTETATASIEVKASGPYELRQPDGWDIYGDGAGQVTWDQFGSYVLVDGDTAVVGGGDDNSCERMYIYRFDGTAWNYVQRIAPISEHGEWCEFTSAAIDGDFAVFATESVSAAMLDFYHWDGNSWVAQQHLTYARWAVPTSHGCSGVGLAIDGDYVMAAAVGDVLVYHWDGTSWVEQESLKAKASEIGLDLSTSLNNVAMEGNYALVSGGGDYGMFRLQDGSWMPQQTLVPAGPFYVQEVLTLAVDANGNAVVGQPDYGGYTELGVPVHSGRALFYHWDGETWVWRGEALGERGPTEYLGRSVDIDGDYTVIGSQGSANETTTNLHTGKIYQWNGERWVEDTELNVWDDATLYGVGYNGAFGCFVSLDQGNLIVAAPSWSDYFFSIGRAYIYDLDGEHVTPQSPPEAGIFSATGSEDSIIVVNGWNYSDADGDAATSLRITALPQHSLLFLDANGNNQVDTAEAIVAGQEISWADATTNGLVKLALDANLHGTTALSYAVNDATAYGTPADALINLLPVNDPTEAGAFTVVGNEDSIIVVNGWNYSDADGDAATSLRITALPQHGILFLDANSNNQVDTGEAIVSGQEISWAYAATNGLVKLAPDADWNGSTALSYAVKDATAYGAPAGVTINVLPVNDPTEAGAFTVTGNEDSTIVVNGWNYTDVDGDAATALTITGLPSHGILFLDANGNNQVDTAEAIVAGQEISWADATTNGLVKLALDANWHGTTALSYAVKDATAYGAPAGVTINVLPVNDPTLAGAFTVTGNEDSIILINGWNYTDVDGDTATSLTLTALPLHGILFLDANGNNQIDTGEAIVAGQEISWADATTNGLVKLAPDKNWNGSTSLSYAAKDATAYGAPANVTINVLPMNELPDAGAFLEILSCCQMTIIDGWNYVDADGDRATGIRIESLPTNGILFLDRDGDNAGGGSIGWIDEPISGQRRRQQGRLQ